MRNERPGLPEAAPGFQQRYPWHAATWDRLARDLNRIPHALLLYGQSGMGKKAFAERLAQALLCHRPAEQRAACGECQSCLLFTAGTHPDVMRVTPLEEGKPIVVDQVRALGEFLSLRPHTADRKVVVIAPADTMNLNAANSLLKQLEEPPPGSAIVLVTSQPVRLPATVRSRCAHVNFPPPPGKEAAAWLRSQLPADSPVELLLMLASGAPLRALALAGGTELSSREQVLRDLESVSAGRDDPITCAARWKSLGTGRCLTWLQGMVCEAIKLAMAEAGSLQTADPDTVVRLRKLIKTFTMRDLFDFSAVVSESNRLLTGPLDELLLLENVLIRWSRMVS